jgi:hypothetical protein
VLSYEHAGKIEAQLKAEVAELLARAEAADQADVLDGMSIPEELARREERLAKLAEARAIEARAKNGLSGRWPRTAHRGAAAGCARQESGAQGVRTEVGLESDPSGPSPPRGLALFPPRIFANLVSTLTDPSQEKAKQFGVRAMRYTVEADGADLGEIASLVVEGKVKPYVQKTLPLASAAEALALVAKG